MGDSEAMHLAFSSTSAKNINPLAPLPPTLPPGYLSGAQQLGSLQGMTGLLGGQVSGGQECCAFFQPDNVRLPAQPTISPRPYQPSAQVDSMSYTALSDTVRLWDCRGSSEGSGQRK